MSFPFHPGTLVRMRRGVQQGLALEVVEVTPDDPAEDPRLIRVRPADGRGPAFWMMPEKVETVPATLRLHLQEVAS